MLNQNFVLTRLNRDDNSTEHQYQNRNLSSMKLAQRLRTQSVPAMVLLDKNGNYLLHLSGFTEAENLQPVLQYIGSGEYKSMQFDEFKNSSGL
jgi:thioredoxin-related protein